MLNNLELALAIADMIKEMKDREPEILAIGPIPNSWPIKFGIEVKIDNRAFKITIEGE